MKTILINPFGVLFNLPSNDNTRKKCFTEINYCRTVLSNQNEFTVLNGAKEFENQAREAGFKIVNVTNANNRDIVQTILQSRGLVYLNVYSIHNNFHNTIEDIKKYFNTTDQEIVIISKRREDIDYAKTHGIKHVDMNWHNFQDAITVLNSIQ